MTRPQPTSAGAPPPRHPLRAADNEPAIVATDRTSGSDGAVFAAALHSWGAGMHPLEETLRFGSARPASNKFHHVTAIGWDGTAFVIHSRDNVTGDRYVAGSTARGPPR